MQVETYECEQTVEETSGMAAEAIEIIEALDLSGQRKLVTPRAAARIPYREMSAEERWVFEILCPEKAKLSDYKASPIPLRVLQIASHAASLSVFGDLFVWATESQSDPDPVLVARIGVQYSGSLFLLARWGEELDEWPALLNKAARIFARQVLAKLRSIKKEVEQEETLVGELDPATLRKQGMPSYYR